MLKSGTNQSQITYFHFSDLHFALIGEIRMTDRWKEGFMSSSSHQRTGIVVSVLASDYGSFEVCHRTSLAMGARVEMIGSGLYRILHLRAR